MPKIIRCLVVLVLAAIVFVLPIETQAQDSPWPDRSENLQVLPDTTGPEALRNTMMSFTRALGVRCHHCHVGVPGQPLSTWDFASDEKREKRVARKMLRMVGTINETVTGIENGSGAVVGCVTCHKGATIPPPQLDELLAELVKAEGSDKAIERYDALRDESFGQGLYDFSGRTFTRVADDLIENGKFGDAVAILSHGADLYPENSFIQSSLSDAYLGTGDTTMAQFSIEKAISLNPRSRFMRSKLKALASH